jgi:3-deoxy-D-manno-octulosonic acid (KDO) 8-phosphate synthase
MRTGSFGDILGAPEFLALRDRATPLMGTRQAAPEIVHAALASDVGGLWKRHEENPGKRRCRGGKRFNIRMLGNEWLGNLDSNQD